MEPNTIKINEVEYVRKDQLESTKGNIKIAVLDRGFVYVGNTKLEEDFLIITGARNIRVWGTTKGLGQLVNGPLKETKLDMVGTIQVPLKALISLIDVEQSKWNSL
jgi:hypothetical protein